MVQYLTEDCLLSSCPSLTEPEISSTTRQARVPSSAAQVGDIFQPPGKKTADTERLVPQVRRFESGIVHIPSFRLWHAATGQVVAKPR